MPEIQPLSPAHLSAIARPSCPRCRQRRMLLSKLGSEPSGCANHTFECQKCGYVSIAVTSNDPVTSDVLGWLAGELRPPT